MDSKTDTLEWPFGPFRPSGLYLGLSGDISTPLASSMYFLREPLLFNAFHKKTCGFFMDSLRIAWICQWTPQGDSWFFNAFLKKTSDFSILFDCTRQPTCPPSPGAAFPPRFLRGKMDSKTDTLECPFGPFRSSGSISRPIWGHFHTPCKFNIFLKETFDFQCIS